MISVKQPKGAPTGSTKGSTKVSTPAKTQDVAKTVVAKEAPPTSAPVINEADARRAIDARVHKRAEVSAPVAGSTLQRSSAGARLQAEEAKGIDEVPQVMGSNFDWDDNIFFMPTRIQVFNKNNDDVVGVSTTDWALVREHVGKDGEYKDFEQRPASLARFADDPTRKSNYFVEDMITGLNASPTAWKGPSWDAFVKACSRRSTAEALTIITARLQSPETIYAGLVEMHRRGMIKYLPLKENIFPVASPELSKRLGGTAASPSEAKAIVMGEVLDKIQKRGLKADAKPVLDPSGTEQRPMHLWGFSDDDFGNFQKAVTALSAEMKKGRWPDVKITLIFTGRNHPTEKPHAVVLQPDGTVRPYKKEELGEVDRLLGASARKTAALDAA